ncbi:hypothetical protein SISNIDRAFT_409261 [Sistotremastrum niveocremeum HHB9708]|uniref:CxC1-like cysteine cluster associated with KDZ transposases domain-containing protein n=1 Tax=Sistotremastrum niveocremeum HHB9708 TaxID=1314777 RepID=A0A164W3L3_9AGAM|nr:hypothetical protein SISNIDRAFT_409261 [Sistotremastrum niveocremeum HHB9708]
MARYGFMATSPDNPAYGISFRVLQYFVALTNRCPQLSIQAFVKTLCYMNCTAFRPSYRNQFSVAIDTYLELQRRIEQRMQSALGRTDKYWNIRHACIPCSYVLRDEPELTFGTEIAIDGNNSLARMKRLAKEPNEAGERESIERTDSRQIYDPIYLDRETVDVFEDDLKSKAKGKGKEPTKEPVVGNPSPCPDRWKNLADDSKKKGKGGFSETGLFLASCRHEAALAFCDMVESGEKFKYPFAVLNELLDLLPGPILIGYDIGCGVSQSAHDSRILGPRLMNALTRFVVGLFHGGGHARSCGIDWSPLYVKGAGLENFEGCEHVFSQSNAVARCTRLASRFHRQQLIYRYFRNWNEERYIESSQFILRRYKDAIAILNTHPSLLADAMAHAQITDTAQFDIWLKEESDYLNRDDDDDLAVDLRVTYFRTLLKSTSGGKFKKTKKKSADEAAVLEIGNAWVKGQDAFLTLQGAAEELEEKLEISERWKPGSKEWKEGAALHREEEFLEALDRLESLVVSRIFELARQGQAGTGYKLRQHISKALTTRQQAIKTALEQYNSLASDFVPPRPTFDAQEIMECAYIGEFDILRLSRRGILKKPWTKPSVREASRLHYKLERAREEVKRLNIEYRRLKTYIVEEEAFLADLELLTDSNPELAYQLLQHIKRFGAANTIHSDRLLDIEALDGFSGDVTIGVRTGMGNRETADASSRMSPVRAGDEDEPEEDASGDELEADGVDVIVQEIVYG